MHFLRIEDKEASQLICKSIRGLNLNRLHKKRLHNIVNSAFTKQNSPSRRLSFLLSVAPASVWADCGSVALATLRASDFGLVSLSVSEQLLDAGADPNTPIIGCSLAGDTLLTAAVYKATRTGRHRSDYVSFISNLLGRGVNVNHRCVSVGIHRSAICYAIHVPHVAVRSNHDILRVLLDHGASANYCCCADGAFAPFPPLHCASHGTRMAEVVRLLIAHNPHARTLKWWHSSCVSRNAWRQVGSGSGLVAIHDTHSGATETLLPETWTRPFDRRRRAAQCAAKLTEDARDRAVVAALCLSRGGLHTDVVFSVFKMISISQLLH